MKGKKTAQTRFPFFRSVAVKNVRQTPRSSDLGRKFRCFQIELSCLNLRYLAVESISFHGRQWPAIIGSCETY
uniref:Uncharacterized protein n=1 Tax=Cucumis sativus TaxID=3659 RepID=A0A0A0L1K3_CUCSA